MYRTICGSNDRCCRFFARMTSGIVSNHKLLLNMMKILWKNMEMLLQFV